MTENEKVMEEVNAKLDEIPRLDNFFITLTTKKGDNLTHYQARMNFPDIDCLPSLDEIRKLIVEDQPKMNRIQQLMRKFN